MAVLVVVMDARLTLATVAQAIGPQVGVVAVLRQTALHPAQAAQAAMASAV
jgi:hypothetical protein